MIHYVTLVDLAYLPRLFVLYESMLAHCRPFALWVIAMTKETERALRKAALPGIGIIPFSYIETSELRELKPSIPFNQYIWASKPASMLHLYQTQPAIEKLCYLDADCFFFSSPQDIFDNLQRKGAWLALTPHRFMPEFKRYLINGRFNGGFIYTVRKPSTLRCLTSWHIACTLLEEKRHRHAEQRHLETWPENWGAVEILHKGLNLAPWNQGENQYRYTLHDSQIQVDDEPLVMYHFHEGLGTRYPLDPFVKEHIYGPYRHALERAGEIYGNHL